MIMTGVVLLIGLAAPVIMKATEQATAMNMNVDQYIEMVNPELRGDHS